MVVTTVECLLLPNVLSACSRCRKGVAGPTVIGDQCWSEFCMIVGKIQTNIKECGAAGGAKYAVKVLLHRYW